MFKRIWWAFAWISLILAIVLLWLVSKALLPLCLLQSCSPMLINRLPIQPSSAPLLLLILTLRNLVDLYDIPPSCRFFAFSSFKKCDEAYSTIILGRLVFYPLALPYFSGDFISCPECADTPIDTVRWPTDEFRIFAQRRGQANIAQSLTNLFFWTREVNLIEAICVLVSSLSEGFSVRAFWHQVKRNNNSIWIWCERNSGMMKWRRKENYISCLWLVC